MASVEAVLAPSRVVRRPRRVALVGAMVAGVATQYQNVAAAARVDPHLDVVGVPVSPYAADAFERWLRVLPASVRGTIRSIAATAPLFSRSGFDLVWTQIDLPLLPWMLTANAHAQAPVIYTADSTPALLRSFGSLYGNWGGRWRIKSWARDRLHSAVLKRAAAVNAWSEWAARSMRDDYGVPAERVTVLPPGVDTEFWSPPQQRLPSVRPRILFVGGDFVRKGGDLLVDVWRTRLRHLADLDIVTARGKASDVAGANLHTGVEPNSARLLALYQQADVLAIPTRADCFSMAGLEGLACGLPVVTCPVGGVAELFSDQEQGFFVKVDDGRALAGTLQQLLTSAPLRQQVSARARRLAVQRYDARRNAERLLSLIHEQDAP